MGYYEIPCQLCEVSFQIARHRTATEPEEAAWDYDGSDWTFNAGTDEHCQPLSETGCSVIRRNHRWQEDAHEHLSGPGCRAMGAYSGASISLEEMKGCRDARAIVKKRHDQKTAFPPEDDDEPWERESRYFFTGTCHGSKSDGELDGLDNDRHGVSNIQVDMDLTTDEDDLGIAVHPTCWEIFKRVSIHTWGFIDIHGWWKLRTVRDREFFDSFPRHPDVCKNHQQWWEHEHGTEWLAANPVDVPGFTDRLGDVKVDTASFDVNGDVFSASPRGGPALASTANDPFAKLPAELRLMVLELLPSRSIAALRVASRSMQPVPCIAFRRLVFEDMPWLWEARDLGLRTTDWFELYKRAKFGSFETKGLKNRARIWEEVSEICQWIQRYRDERRIQGITGWEDNAEDDS